MADQPGDVPVFLRRAEGVPPQAVRLTREQVLFIRHLLISGDQAESCKVSNLSMPAATAFLAREEIKAYVEQRLLEAASSAGLTTEKVMSRVAELVESPMAVASQAHLKGLDMAARILNLIKPASNIQQTIVQNPLAGKSDEELDEEARKRLEYRSKPVTEA